MTKGSIPHPPKDSTNTDSENDDDDDLTSTEEETTYPGVREENLLDGNNGQSRQTLSGKRKGVSNSRGGRSTGALSGGKRGKGRTEKAKRPKAVVKK